MRRLIPRLIAIAAVLAGCVAGSARSVAAPPQAPTLSLFVQPGAHTAPVRDLISSARASIRLEVYLLTNRAIVGALGKAVQRHVDVRVLLEQHPYGATRYATLGHNLLQAAHVPVRWANESAFTYTHEKAMIVDGQVAGIFTFNLTSSGLFTNREFGVIDPAPADARALSSIFDADWTRRSVKFSSSRLVISPYNSRSDLMGLIAGARHTLDVYAEEVDDGLVEGALARAKRRGVRVRLITSAGSAGVDTIRRSGVAVKIMPHPYVHAKALVADGQTFFVGSENISTTSLDQNREAGIMLNDAELARVIERTFAGDWKEGGFSSGTGAPPPSGGSSHGFAVRVTTSPRSVSRGQRLSITATTSPGASCSVRVTYPDGYVSRSKALKETRTAGNSGKVDWSYRVGSTVTGVSHVDVSCSLNGATASGSVTFTIG